MIFDEVFFEQLPSDLTEALLMITNRFIEFNESIGGSNRIDNYELFMDAYAALEIFLVDNKIDNKYSLPDLESDRGKNINKISEFYYSIHEHVSGLADLNQLEASRYKYKIIIGKSFSYNFSDGDLQKIQELINDLRNKISESNIFTENHKERLLRRLEKLQKELHKKMSNLDQFWGLIGDAGVVLGKFGNDAKPFIDVIKTITDIVWRVQSSAEELPSGTTMPMLDRNTDKIDEK